MELNKNDSLLFVNIWSTKKKKKTYIRTSVKIHMNENVFWQKNISQSF